MKKITCHQFATGRGQTGYGFIAYSKKDPRKQEPTYSFSLNKWIGLRFAQLPSGIDYVLEIEPASTDYRHAGAMITRNREEGGSSSVYTHALITEEQPQEAEALGLLKIQNFLTPEEFSEVTHADRNLEYKEIACDLPVVEYEPLNQDQKKNLGEFLARYWALLEQKEWSRKGTAELALLLAGMNQAEMIAFFGREVVPCLPTYVRPAISVSFGANWYNRGTSPCVCCVLADNSESPFPCYYPEAGKENYARKVGPVEQAVGQMLVKRDPSLYPEAYRRLERLAEEDDACRNMARSFSAMAYCLQAEMDRNSAENMRKVYDSLVTLAEKRYEIKPERIREAFLPLIQDIFDQYCNTRNRTPEDVTWMIQQNIALHRTEKIQADELESLKKNDDSLMICFNALPLEQMKNVLYGIWTELKQTGLDSNVIFRLLKNEENALLSVHINDESRKYIKSAIEQCVRIDKEDVEEAKELTGQYREWLCREANSKDMLETLGTMDSVLHQDEECYFSLLEGINDQPARMNEAAIVDYLKVLNRANRKNPARAGKLIKDTYQNVLNGVARTKEVSSGSFTIISETILSQEQIKENAPILFDFAIRNANQPGAPAFLNQIVGKLMTPENVEDPEFQKTLFQKLEEAAETGKHFRMDDAIRKLLEKTNNVVVSDRPLEYCDRLKRARQDEYIERYFENIEMVPGNKQNENWNKTYARKLSIKWEDLRAEDIAAPVEKRFLNLYEQDEDKTGFLCGIWDQIHKEESSVYNMANRNAVIKKLTTEYDPLWQKGTEDERKRLDDLVQACSDEDPDSKIRDKCNSTTAGKAGTFLSKLRELSRLRMDILPQRAGELIRTMRKENGFNQCIKIDYQMDHKEEDELYRLVIVLLQEIQKSPQGDHYWKEPLEELGFDQNIPAWGEDGLRMVNILAYITRSLDVMGIPEMGDDLRSYLGEKYMGQLWKQSNADKNLFHGQGEAVLQKSLYQWMIK